MGRALYEALADRLQAMGILNLYACIGYPQAEDEYLTRNLSLIHILVWSMWGLSSGMAWPSRASKAASGTFLMSAVR